MVCRQPIKIIKGIRICHVCRGICHGECWRSKNGRKKIYFDSERCLRHYIEEKIGYRIKDVDCRKYRDRFYEKVFVRGV